jgi:hypothetical protein
MGFPTGEIRAIIHLIKPQGRPNFYLHSAFPWLAAGPTARLLIGGTHTNHFGLEGFIDTSTAAGSSVSFFDPLFALNKARYRVGALQEFSLAGLSLDLKQATGGVVRISNQETVAHMRKAEVAAAGQPSSSPGYIEVDMSGAQGLMPVGPDARDYHFFHGRVSSVRNADFLDRPFLVFRTAVLQALDGDIGVDIYIDRARFGSRPVPTEGDVVSGTLWLQGQSLETV